MPRDMGAKAATYTPEDGDDEDNGDVGKCLSGHGNATLTEQGICKCAMGV